MAGVVEFKGVVLESWRLFVRSPWNGGIQMFLLKKGCPDLPILTSR